MKAKRDKSGDGIVLHLNQEEADFLFILTEYIGGDPDYSKRCISDRLKRTLIPFIVQHTVRSQYTDYIHGVIQFLDEY